MEHSFLYYLAIAFVAVGLVKLAKAGYFARRKDGNRRIPLEVNQYDTVLLRNGEIAAIVEKLSETYFIADIGDSPENWETIDLTIEEIEKAVWRQEV